MFRNLLIGSFVLFCSSLTIAQTEGFSMLAPEPVIVNGTKVYPLAEVDPKFPGDQNALAKFMNDSLVYPEAAIEQKIEGKVYLSFIVQADGSVTNVVVDKGLHPLLDQEAVRVLSKSPKWTAGKVGEKDVASYVRLPIAFTVPVSKLNHNTTRSNRKN